MKQKRTNVSHLSKRTNPAAAGFVRLNFILLPVAHRHLQEASLAEVFVEEAFAAEVASD